MEERDARLAVAVAREEAVGQEADLAGRLMATHPGLRLIVLSVHDEPSVADHLIAAGVAGFVVKRAAATDLVPAVRAVLAGGTYVSPAVQHAPGGPPPPRRL